MKYIFKYCGRTVGVRKPQPPTSQRPGPAQSRRLNWQWQAQQKGRGWQGVPVAPTESLGQWQGWLHNVQGSGSETVKRFKLATAKH